MQRDGYLAPTTTTIQSKTSTVIFYRYDRFCERQRTNGRNEMEKEMEEELTQIKSFQSIGDVPRPPETRRELDSPKMIDEAITNNQ